MDSTLKTAIFVQKMIYRVDESIVGTESFQIISSFGCSLIGLRDMFHE